MRRSRPDRRKPITIDIVAAADTYRRLDEALTRRSTDTKASNPKEAFGDAKMPLDLLPDTAVVQFNLAFLEGALKYGQYNWRIAGVKVSTYVRAARRHLSKFWNGQDHDPATLVHELASVGACVAVLLDAISCGKITDDRPPRADMEDTLARAAATAKHLKQLFATHTPPQYTEVEHGEAAQAAKRHAQYMETMAAVDPRPVKALTPYRRRKILAEMAAANVPTGTKRRNPTSRKKLMAAIRKGRKPRGRGIDPNG